MDKVKQISKIISNITTINETHIYLFIRTILFILIITILQYLVLQIIKRIKNSKKEYMYSQNLKVICNILKIITVVFIWAEYIRNILTLITFVSAAFTIALREFIFNFFAGVYIKIKKTISIEDRIEINGIKGDVINIKMMNFEVLEVEEDNKRGQSTGIIVNFPNAIIFKEPLKNYSKAFKYVWDELKIRVPLDTDINKTKSILYKIVNNNEVIKAIPLKMKRQLQNINTEYRIYYNQYEPIIYTEIMDNYIELQIRYLIHPKKARYVASTIWNKIIESYHNKEIELFKD